MQSYCVGFIKCPSNGSCTKKERPKAHSTLEPAFVRSQNSAAIYFVCLIICVSFGFVKRLCAEIFAIPPEYLFRRCKTGHADLLDGDGGDDIAENGSVLRRCAE